MARPKDAVLSRICFKVMPEVCRLVPDFASPEEATSWLRKIRQRAWYKRRWEARYPNGGPALFPNGVRFPTGSSLQRCTSEVEYKHMYLALDPDKQNGLEVLHILAHALQPEEGPWHGAEFSQTYFDLVERAFDKDVRRQVRDIFRKYKIKTRSVSGATREKQREAMLDRQAGTAKVDAQALLRELTEMGRDHGRGR